MKQIYNGKEVEAIRIDFFNEQEKWNEYQLSDGRVLRVKFILTDVIKLTGIQDKDGKEVYRIRTANPIVRIQE